MAFLSTLEDNLKHFGLINSKRLEKECYHDDIMVDYFYGWLISELRVQVAICFFRPDEKNWNFTTRYASCLITLSSIRPTVLSTAFQ